MKIDTINLNFISVHFLTLSLLQTDQV